MLTLFPCGSCSALVRATISATWANAGCVMIPCTNVSFVSPSWLWLTTADFHPCFCIQCEIWMLQGHTWPVFPSKASSFSTDLGPGSGCCCRSCGSRSVCACVANAAATAFCVSSFKSTNTATNLLALTLFLLTSESFPAICCLNSLLVHCFIFFSLCLLTRCCKCSLHKKSVITLSWTTPSSKSCADFG